MLWSNRRRPLDLSRRGVLMGILNVTPDSFSDGGRYAEAGPAVGHALSMLAEGAEIIDIGGESTRPGATPVTAEEERRRIVPVVRGLRTSAPDALISIDTAKASVAEAALEAGADIINDVSALRGDPAMLPLARTSGAGICLMHMRGEPGTMQQAPEYDDVVGEVSAFLRSSCAQVVAAGIAAECLALDPGIGFGKTREHNLALLGATARLASAVPGRPIVLGVSRKSFLGGRVEDRFWSGVALTAALRREGARIFRVHDVKAHHDALRMTEAIIHGV